MRRLILLIIVIISYVRAEAQTQNVYYFYDANGNRIERKVYTYGIGGKISYGTKPLKQTEVKYKDVNQTEYTVNSDDNGNYLFDIPEGTYTPSKEPPFNWGGVNAKDALLIDKYFVEIYNFKDEIYKKAADLNNDGKINPTDALYILKRTVELIPNFKVDNWLYLPDLTNLALTVDGTNPLEILNIKMICAGDVDGSRLQNLHISNFSSSYNTSNEQEKDSTNIFISEAIRGEESNVMKMHNINNYLNSMNGQGLNCSVSIDSIRSKTGEEVLMKLRVQNFNNVGAFGFKIKYSDSVLTYKSIESVNDDLSGMVYANVGNSVNFAWHSTGETGLELGDTLLLNIKFTYNGGSTNLEFQPESMVGDMDTSEFVVTFKNGYVGPGIAVEITEQPESVTSCQSSVASFTVTTTGTEPFSYQWKKIIENGELIIDNATSSKFEISEVSLEDEGEYYCVVSNMCGSVTSSMATLTTVYNGNMEIADCFLGQESYIDSTAQIDTTSILIGDGIYIGSNTIINANVQIRGCVRIGNNCIINQYSSINESNSIGDTTIIGINVKTGKNVNIGNKSEIGLNTRIGQNVYIGSGCEIGANVVIGNDVQINDSTIIENGSIIKDGSMIGYDVWDCLSIQLSTGIYSGPTHIGGYVKIGSKSNIGAGINIGNNSRVGNRVIIANGMQGGENVLIGDFVNINKDVIISDTVKIADGSYVGKIVNLGSKVHIGINAVVRDSASIMSGISIADKSIIQKDTVINNSIGTTPTEPFVINNECEFARDNARIYGNFMYGFSADTTTQQILQLNNSMLNLNSVIRMNRAIDIKNGYRVNDKITFYAENISETYRWDFGDCGTSTLESPEHRYTKPGIYVIKLTQTSTEPCQLEKSYTGAITIYPVDKAKLKQQDAPVCNEEHKGIFRKEHKLSNMRDASCFSNDSLCKSWERMDSTLFRVAYLWIFENQMLTQANMPNQQQISMQQTDTTDNKEYLSFEQIKQGDTIHTTNNFSEEGEYNIQLISTTQVMDLITGKWAGTASEFIYQDTIKIDRVYMAEFGMPESACTQDTVEFTDNSKHCLPISYHWEFGNDSTSTLQNPKMQYAEEGDYEVKLVITDTLGVRDSIVKTIYVGNYCDIKGTLISSVNCNSTPAKHDTLVFKNSLGLYQGLETITDDSGHFAFNVRKLRDVDFDSVLYRIELKRGIGIDDTNSRTISEWISQSPVSLRLKNVVQEWEVKFGNIDTSGVATAIDIMDNVYVTGTTLGNTGESRIRDVDYASENLRINNNMSISQALASKKNFITTIKYAPDGKRKWVACYVDSSNCYSSLMTIDKNNNIYIAGYTRPYILNSDDAAGLYISQNTITNFIVLKYDSLGNFKWSTKYHIDSLWDYSKPVFIKVDNSGNVYLNGLIANASASSQFCCNNLCMMGGHYCTIKYNSSGTQQWIKMLGDNDNIVNNIGGCSLDLDSLGNVFIAGGLFNCNNNQINYYLSVSKYDTDGGLLWNSQYSLTDTIVGIENALKVDNLGNAYISGSSIESNDFTKRENFILKYNSIGNLQWTEKIPYALLPNIKLNSSGDIWVCGNLPGDSANSGMNYSINKFSSNGDSLWSRVYNANSFAINPIYTGLDNDDNLYVSGTNVDISTGNRQFVSNLIKYSADGDVVWEISHRNETWSTSNLTSGLRLSSGVRIDYDYTIPNVGMVISPNNNIYIAGGAQEYDTLNGEYYNVFTTLKYSQCPETAHMLRKTHFDNSSKKDITEKDTKLKLYPNPNDGKFMVDINIPYDSKVEIEVYNMIGSKVIGETQYLKKGENILNLNINNPMNGIYLIAVKTEKEVFNRKVVIK